MSEETTAPEAEVEETETETTVETTETETKPEGQEPEAKETPEGEEPESEEAKAEKERKNKVSAKDRISQLTREKYEERRQREELQQRLEQIESKLTDSQPEPQKPKFADFDSDSDYERALDDYYAKKTEHEREKAVREQRQQEQQQRQLQEQQQNATKFLADIQAKKEKFQDFDTVLNDPTFAQIANHYKPEIVSMIQGSDKNVELFYHLGTHLDDAEKIAALPPVQAARELALIESRLGTPDPKKVTNAPPPTKSTSGSATNKKDFSDPKARDSMSDEEWLEWRNKTKKVM